MMKNFFVICHKVSPAKKKKKGIGESCLMCSLTVSEKGPDSKQVLFLILFTSKKTKVLGPVPSVTSIIS